MRIPNISFVFIVSLLYCISLHEANYSAKFENEASKEESKEEVRASGLPTREYCIEKLSQMIEAKSIDMSTMINLQVKFFLSLKLLFKL